MIEFRIKEKTRSLNESFRGDWRPRDTMAKRQRTKAMQACPKWPSGPLLVVRVTRVSPRELDSHDNLRGALKHIVDGVAARLRIDDASPLVEWEYHQAKGEAEVVVQIWRWNAEGDAPPLPVGRDGTAPKRGAIIGKRPFAVRVESSGYDPSRTIGMGHAIQPIMKPTSAEKREDAAFDKALPSGQRLRSPPTKGAKAGRMDYVEAYTPLPELHPDDAAFHAEVMRRVGLKAAHEAEATFAPGSRMPPDKQRDGCDNCEGIQPESCMFRSNH